MATKATAPRQLRAPPPRPRSPRPVSRAGRSQATVKAQLTQTLEDSGSQILLANTYHLYLRPGHELIREMGGLHSFMSWRRPILTDSGGFQVFSLSDLRKVTDEGVTFRSHLDGSPHFFSPEKALEVECIEAPADLETTRAAATRTLDWARRSRRFFDEHGDAQKQMLFGIVQGGTHAAVRRENADALVDLDFPGYAVGGLAVGEPHLSTCAMTAEVTARLPVDRPRYLMGVGMPEQIVDYVMRGIDMMDCVLPTRSARHGCLFTSQGKLLIKNARYAKDPRPIDPACGCAVCARYSRAYLRHLYASNESLAAILNSHHNIYFYLDIMAQIRKAIRFGTLEKFAPDLQARLANKLSSTGV